METFRKWAVELDINTFDSRGQEYFFRVVTDPFYAKRYVNYRRYLERDREETTGQVIEGRKPNVQFRAAKTVSRGEFTKHKLLPVVAPRKIKVGEKLPVDYKEKFMF